ncbi:MAG: DUF4407 domain-containing protein [Tannerella sp.]|jgi:hypothetical protein|nr:DUF4407 domain-containing protein [Tannerella sp.]
MKKMNYISCFFLFCAGVDYRTIMQTTSSEVTKYRILGACVLIPAVLALFSGYYAMYLVSHSEVVALLFAPVWSLIIFTLDRAVVACSRPGRFTFGVFARIFLAVIIALTVSETALLALFDDAIEEKRVFVVSEKQDQLSADYDAQITAIQNRSNVERGKIEDLRTSYIQEVDGTGGSGHPFRGPIAKVKENAYLAALADFHHDEEIRQQQIAAIRLERNEQRQIIADKNFDGLLGNMIILGQLGKESSTVLWWTWIIRLLLLGCELIPIMIKLGLPQESLYHSVLDINNGVSLDLHRYISSEKDKILRLEAAVATESERARLLSLEIRNKLVCKSEDCDFFSEQITRSAERQLKYADRITSNVEDADSREKLFGQLKIVHETYSDDLKVMMIRTFAN